MEQEYWTVCEVCDTETQVLVMDAEEVPQFCPMCGSGIEFQSMSDEEEE